MNQSLFSPAKFLTAMALAGSLIFVPAALSAQADNSHDAQLKKDASDLLNKKQFREIHSSVQDGVVTLTGTVDRLIDKMDAEKRIRKAPNLIAINDQIQVGGPQVEDATLTEKLNRKLNFDISYGPVVFNAFTVSAQNGIVTVGGVADSPANKDVAIGIVADYPGVKGLIDNVQVAPLSGMDNGTRLAEYRSIYGFPTLSKYAMDPNKPIRILVANGHVTLVGTVDTQADKDVANIRANAVPGVFSVKNDLQVANPSSASR